MALHLAPLPRNRAVLMPYDPRYSISIQVSPKIKGAANRRSARADACRLDQVRYRTRQEAMVAAQRLVNCTVWTQGEVVVRECRSCRGGYHILMRGGRPQA